MLGSLILPGPTSLISLPTATSIKSSIENLGESNDMQSSTKKSAVFDCNNKFYFYILGVESEGNSPNKKLNLKYCYRLGWPKLNRDYLGHADVLIHKNVRKIKIERMHTLRHVIFNGVQL